MLKQGKVEAQARESLIWKRQENTVEHEHCKFWEIIIRWRMKNKLVEKKGKKLTSGIELGVSRCYETFGGTHAFLPLCNTRSVQLVFGLELLLLISRSIVDLDKFHMSGSTLLAAVNHWSRQNSQQSEMAF